MKGLILAVCILASSFTYANSTVYNEAVRILDHVTETSYTHHPYINEKQGIYDLDCSAFAGYVLSRATPAGYEELISNLPKKKRPLAKDFVAFFRPESEGIHSQWKRLKQISELVPGDLVAWLIPPESTSKDTGHVMIVGGIPKENAAFANEWLVPVIDSTSTRHGSADPRREEGPNGVGLGTIGLIASESGEPIAFRWSGGESPKVKYTEIRMARL